MNNQPQNLVTSVMYRRLAPIRRVAILVVVLVFLSSSITFAATKNIFDTKKSLYTPAPTESTPEKTTPAAKATATNELGIPEDIGLIKESFKGKDDKLVVHIQDAHCNYEAQTNISKILEILRDKKGLILIAIEGSSGEIDTSLFTSFPDEDIRREVADYFMKKGKISGAEFFAINTKKPIILYGIENKDYYLENLKAFTNTLSKRGLAKKACDEIKAYLDRLKQYIYSKELKEFDAKISDYNEDRLKFTDFCIYMNDVAAKRSVDLAKYVNFTHLVNSLKKEEKIDFGKVDAERSTIINELEKKLTQNELSDLFTKSLSYRTKKMTSSEYYTYLKGLAEGAKIDLSGFKNFNLYVDYLVDYAKIDNAALFKELKNLEDDIAEALYTNNDQRKLARLLKNIKLFSELLDISLSKEDAAYLNKNGNEFNSSEFTVFIKQQASKYALAYSPNPNSVLIDELLPTLNKFYQIAEKRESALLENTLKKMDEKKLKMVVLISGGYHTEGLVKRLKDNNISYFVVSPRITDLDAETPYLEVISGSKQSLEEVLPEGKE